MNTCLHVLKEIKWILSFSRVYLKFIEYFPDYLSALSRTLLRFFFGQPLSKQLYTPFHDSDMKKRLKTNYKPNCINKESTSERTLTNVVLCIWHIEI